VLNGAPMRPGVATLAQLAQAPVLPCVIIGTDRLYNRRNWLPLRRTGIWISFGEPITINATDDKETARALLREKLAAAYRDLLRELRETFSLTEEDLPHTPQERMIE
jgi:1-acyl-sn-glycerol-3-phosphate acyltransferase